MQNHCLLHPKKYFSDGLQNLHIKQEVRYVFMENVNKMLALFTFILSSMQLSNLKLAAWTPASKQHKISVLNIMHRHTRMKEKQNM